MSDAPRQMSARGAELFKRLQACMADLAQSGAHRLPADFAELTMALGDFAEVEHLTEFQETVRSLNSFAEKLRDRDLDEQDNVQLKALFDNLARAWHHGGAPAVIPPW